MANKIRTMLRKLLDHEVGVLGEEIVKVQEANDALYARIEGLTLRFETMQSRNSMRLMRAERVAPLPTEPRAKSDAEILADLQAESARHFS